MGPVPQNRIPHKRMCLQDGCIERLPHLGCAGNINEPSKRFNYSSIDLFKTKIKHVSMQTPVEIRTKIQEPCTKMSAECSYALRELAMGIRTMTCAPSADLHIVNAKAASKKLKSLLKSGLWPDSDLLEIIPTITVASLLIEVVSCTVKVADSVHELASLSRFKSPDPKMKKQTSLEKVKRSPSIEESHSFSIIVE